MEGRFVVQHGVRISYGYHSLEPLYFQLFCRHERSLLGVLARVFEKELSEFYFNKNLQTMDLETTAGNFS